MKTIKKDQRWCKLGLCAGLLGLAGAVSAVPISLSTPTGTYTQNFDALTTTSWENGVTLEGWYLYRAPAPGSAVSTIALSAGPSSGGFYSMGAAGSSDRALGGVGSSSFSGWIAVGFSNNSGFDVDDITVSWAGEQWRKSRNASAHTMVFEYGFGGAFDSVGSWTRPGDTFDWISPVTGDSDPVSGIGNGDGRVAGVGGGLADFNWLAGSTLWLRWLEVDDVGNDHALAIDDFSLTWRAPNPGGNGTSVPDAGSSLALFGLAIGGLCFLGRRFKR